MGAIGEHGAKRFDQAHTPEAAQGMHAIGRASVMAVVLFVILVGVTAVQHLYFRRRISYDLT